MPVRDREAPGSNSSSPWLHIQSEALQDIAFQPPAGPTRALDSSRIAVLDRSRGDG